MPQCYKDTIGLGQTDFLNCKVVRTSNESWPITALLPEDADANPLSNLGEEVEMKTIKTNVPPTLECDKDQALIIKIICLGGYMFGWEEKGSLSRIICKSHNRHGSAIIRLYSESVATFT